MSRARQDTVSAPAPAPSSFAPSSAARLPSSPSFAALLSPSAYAASAASYTASPLASHTAAAASLLSDASALIFLPSSSLSSFAALPSKASVNELIQGLDGGGVGGGGGGGRTHIYVSPPTPCSDESDVGDSGVNGIQFTLASSHLAPSLPPSSSSSPSSRLSSVMTRPRSQALVTKDRADQMIAAMIARSSVAAGMGVGQGLLSLSPSSTLPPLTEEEVEQQLNAHCSTTATAVATMQQINQPIDSSLLQSVTMLSSPSALPLHLNRLSNKQAAAGAGAGQTGEGGRGGEGAQAATQGFSATSHSHLAFASSPHESAFPSTSPSLPSSPSTSFSSSSSPLSAASASASALSSSSPPLPLPPSTSLPLEDQWRLILSSSFPLSSLRLTDSVRGLLIAGVPASVRPLVWMKLSGASDERQRHAADYYARLIEIHSVHGCSFDDDIEKDIRRTLPALNVYQQKGEVGREAGDKLRRVLAAYCLRNHLTGYCQGMNVIGATLLSLLDEEEAFWLLCCLIESRGGYYTRSMCGLEVDMRVLTSLIQFHLPLVYSSMKKFDVVVESFAVSWFVCLGCEAPLSLAACVTYWDWLLVYGDELLFLLALELLQSSQRELLRCREAAELLDFLLHGGIRRGVDVVALLRRMRIGAHAEEILRLREFHCGEVVASARRLNTNTARRLAAQYKFTDAAAIQRLWEAFLEPAPWTVLLHSSINNTLRFHQAFIAQVFTAEQRGKWRDSGLLSGVLDRLFACLDVTRNGSVSFEEYCRGVHVLTKGDADERMQLCFRWYDANADNFVDQQELSDGFDRFHLMFTGAHVYNVIHDETEREVSSLFASMIFDRARSESARVNSNLGELIARKGLSFTHFKALISLHPFSQLFFGLPEADDESIGIKRKDHRG